MVKKEKQKVGELVFGINPIVELLKARKRKIISIYTTKPVPKGWQQIEKNMPKYPVPIQYVSRDVLHRMAGTIDHQGVLAWAYPFAFRKKLFDPQKESFLIMLDGIQDPHNLGAIIRSAYCTGADGVVLCKKNAAPLNATALKASAGLAEYMQIYQSPSPQAAVQELKKAGYALYLATFDGKSPDECLLEQPLCLVVGSEGTGISKEILKSGTHITLQQRTADISYNASVAAGILLFLIGIKNSRI
jgi:23S rRNA (guanosine2251-2'-O)-methyltransferase